MLAAMPRELRPIVRARSLARRDVAGIRAWSSGTLVAAAVGVGPEAARRGAELVLEATGAGRVLVVGVAGAVAPWLAVGDVVVPLEVVDGAGTRFHPHDPARAGAPGTARHPTPGTRHGPSPGTARRGVLATVVRLGDAVPGEAWAVDMETAAIAAVCERRGIPWDVRRAVSDAPGTLRPELASLLRPDGRTDGWAVATLLGRHPTAAIALAKVGRDAGRAVRAACNAALAELASLEGSGH